MNHLGNCTVCHAKSVDDGGSGEIVGFPAPVPEYGQPLPTAYYDEPLFLVGGGVQADVVYLQQDFSVVHVTKQFDPWPAEQRYDYLVQNRPLIGDEAAAAQLDVAAAKPKSYPQRDAVAAALAYLSRPGR
jgi:hypothetical protein